MLTLHELGPHGLRQVFFEERELDAKDREMQVTQRESEVKDRQLVALKRAMQLNIPRELAARLAPLLD